MNEIIKPEQLAKEGKKAYQRGDFASAARSFQAASQGFASVQDNLNAAEMANNASVAYLQAEEPNAALDVLKGTPETFQQAGDIRRQGLALGNYGATLEALGRIDEAMEAYSESAELLAEAGEDQFRANVMQSLSTLQMRSGRQLEALATMQSGLDGVSKPSPKQRFLKKLLGVPFRMMER